MIFVMWKPKIRKRKMRNVAEMLEELDGIYNPALRVRMERGIVSKLIRTKKCFGMGLKKYTIWTDQLADEFHKQAVKNFENEKCMWTESIKSGSQTSWTCNHFQGPTAVSSIFWLWLMYFQNVSGCFHWKTKLEFLSRKQQKEIFKQRKPQKLWTDKGK